ncbi:uncharacterized protein LOC135125695 [Zophobas morio]|uniref:uncharacterized protein LOC135125695 n=1 Tax=Zophobas morio TaxID=2755281 RepID=UPI003082E482
MYKFIKVCCVVSTTTTRFNRLIIVKRCQNMSVHLVFTNIRDLQVSSAVDPIFAESYHHIPYSWSIFYIPSSKKLSSQANVFDFANGDFQQLNYFLASINWVNLFSGLELDDMVFKKSGRYDGYEYFKILRTHCKELNENLYNSYLSKVSNSITNNPQFFWKFINDRKKSSGIPCEMQYFQKFAKTEDANNDFDQEFDGINEVPDSGLKVELSEVFENIARLKHSFHPGADGIPNVLLKNCIYTITMPLCELFKVSLSQAKQLEWISSSIISIKQHGFRKQRSTSTNLMEYYCYLNEAFDKKLQVYSVYTDFSKAFDKVNHRLLFCKLRHLGFNNNTVKWLTSFLSERSQQVRIGSYMSSPYLVPSGVPQGSHCGPILFLLFINDLMRGFRYSNFLLYADDLKVFKTVSSVKDALELQSDLNILYDWTENNLLPLNVNKCLIISFLNIKLRVNLDYYLGNSILSRVEEVKDLGVLDPWDFVREVICALVCCLQNFLFPGEFRPLRLESS